MTAAWPVAELDRIARLRALASGLPGAVMQERVIDAPFDDVWGFVADLETSVPEFDREVTRVEIVESSGERLQVRTWTRGLRVPVPFDVVLRRGWMWMVASPRLYVVGMAALPAGPRTRLAHLEGPAGRALRPVLPLARWPVRRHVGRDLDGIERAVASRRRPEDRG